MFRIFKRLLPGLFSLSLLLAADGRLQAQTTTGGLQGNITDASGAILSKARVLATDEATGEKRETFSDPSGLFRLQGLKPDLYTVDVDVAGFKQSVFHHVVVTLAQVGTLNAKLEIGNAQEQVTVTAGNSSSVDTVSTESGTVITQSQIENLAIVGRNVMDLAQLAPGVQLRDGNDIDPTKNNFTIAAFQGRSGRETQVQWDGLSLQDHTVGGAIQNIGLDAIQEFQVAQATLHPSQSVASGGAVNMLSRTGGNQLHGSAFEFFRDSRLGAKQGPIRSPYDRNQLGGRIGGALIPDKLFLFADEELTDTRDAFYANTPFAFLNHSYGKPFKENFTMGRVDWTLNDRWSAFSRYSYSFNHGVVGYPSLGNSYVDSLNNKSMANVFGGGITHTGASSVHSLKYGYSFFSQLLLPNNNAPSPVDASGRKYLIQIDGGSTLSYGPNWLANQYQKQKTYQVKYDGSKLLGHHSLSFGGDFTRWKIGADYPLRINAPELDSQRSAATASLTDPTQFPLLSVIMGNGLGYSYTEPTFGLPHGGVGEWRPAAYLHDAWTLPHHVTLNAGLRYVWMSNQFDTGLDRGTLINQFRAGYGGKLHSPKTDFAPQVGVAWDPSGSGKTVIRSAFGVYFEELSYDGFANNSASFIPSSIAIANQTFSSGTPVYDPRSGQPFAAGDPLAAQYGFPDGTSGQTLAPIFTKTIGDAAKQILDLNKLYVAAAAANASRPSASAFDINRQLFYSAFTAGVKNPRVFQFNVGVQRNLSRGLVVTAEYLSVHAVEFPLIVDGNAVGSALPANFDKSVASNALMMGNASVNCPADPAAIDCAIANGATIATYSGFGLGAGPASLVTGGQGYAFRGQNPNFGVMSLYTHQGFNTYNGLNLRLDGTLGAMKRSGFEWVRGNSVTIAYTLARNTGNIRGGSNAVSDVSAFAPTWDNLRPTHFVGPDSLDRTSMLNIGTITQMKGGFVFSQISHWYSPLAQNTLIPTAFNQSSDPTVFKGCANGPEEIFCSDVQGDGTTNDFLPTASGPGAYGRSLKHAAGLNKALNLYNSSYAGQPTPAGKLLISQGLISAGQLQALNGVMPALPLAPRNQVGLDLLLLTDVRLGWKHKFFGERLEVEPSWDAFNIFNRTSYDSPNNILNGNLYGTPGSINGTTPALRNNARQRGSGTFEQGARRQMQAGLRLTF